MENSALLAAAIVTGFSPYLLSHISLLALFSLRLFLFSFSFFFFLIFHLLLLSPALAFIHRANYALQCVAVAIVPPAQTPQLIGAVYILYIYMYFILYSILGIPFSVLRTSKVKDGGGRFAFWRRLQRKHASLNECAKGLSRGGGGGGRRLCGVE